MLIQEPTTPLGAVDCQALTQSVLALAERAWLGDPRRQQDYDVHAQTQSVILLFCNGWPDLVVTRGSGWEPLAAQAMPVIKQVAQRHYGTGGTVLRAMMTRLAPGCRIARHKDSHPSFQIAHRVHIPLVTNPDVEFIVGDEHVPPRPHFAFELNNLMFHQVVNKGNTDRIHFIFDYAPRASVRPSFDKEGHIRTHTRSPASRA